MATESHDIAAGNVTTVPPLKSMEDFMTFVSDQGLRCWSETNQDKFFVACEIHGEDSRLGVMLDGSLLHLELYLPTLQATTSSMSATALGLCRINSVLRLPGFSLHPETLALTFRVSVLLDDMGLASETFRTLLATTLSTAEEHWDELSAAVATKDRGSGRILHARHPAVAPEDKDRYATVRDYLSTQRPAQEFEINLAAGSPGTINMHDMVGRGDCGVVWNWFTGEFLGLVEAEGVSLLVDGDWQVTGPDAFTKQLRESGPLIIATRLAAQTADDVDPLLNRLGFNYSYDEVVVERSLQESLPAAKGALTWSEHWDVPTELLNAAIQDSSNRILHGIDVPRFLERCRAEQEAVGLPLWRIAEIEGAAVGLVNLGVPDDGHGALGFIGVLPSSRGRGVGRALHATALHALSQRGDRYYRDMTDVDNVAMQRIFFWNGCCAVRTIRSFRLM